MNFGTIGLLGRGGDETIPAMLTDLADWLKAQGLKVSTESQTLSVRDDQQRIESEFSRLKPDLVIVIGGDGTILNAAHLLAAHDTPLLGINVGRLGFLADIPIAELRDSVGKVLAGQFTEEQRFLLTGTVHRDNGQQQSHIALNDIVVQKSESGRLIEFETHVDGNFVCTHRADGLIVSTPTGSTAYALSCGGPILHPTLDAVALVPICPHILSDRPIIVGSECTIDTILTRGTGDPVGQVNWDGQQWQPLGLGDRISVTRAAQSIRLLHPLDHDYYKTLRTKLHWGHGRD